MKYESESGVNNMLIKDKERMTQILHDPEVYYFYYHEKYKATGKTIQMLQNKKATPEFLIHLRVVLGEMYGKTAIAFGAIHGLNVDTLLGYWIQIENQKETAGKSFESVRKFEKTILNIEKEVIALNREKYKTTNESVSITNDEETEEMFHQMVDEDTRELECV